ncbi:XRE family transcriptional regulator [Ktedonosporobacter rubrisoli]|uniref:XRE family transcriptional regulator n=1 Tax=Ktedonosporobacter rubrisoli TaxID=2509675 RepID=A0A4P6JXQ6_KTERU|nr:FxSxx-COOH system tetratricopeptide repeat protein [Ktedonosporobacter rubrisoli]QBD80547.1 XRE family transcriptional regulator [Ktedonosporobacter rubrisoli]
MEKNGAALHSFGSLLKEFRRRKKLTQQQLADGVGVHRNAIGRWEQGHMLPASRNMVLELSRYLRLDAQEARELLEASLTGLSPHWLVPFHRNQHFTGREEMLSTLHSRLAADETATLSPTWALYGLGGVGKTQIALEYAYRYGLEYSAVFWIAAETVESIVASFRAIAEKLEIVERQQAEQHLIISAVQYWIETHSKWLLIWDNLEDFSLFQRFLPSIRRGAALITTRCQVFGTLAQGLAIPAMEAEEALLFLLSRAKVLKGEAAHEQMEQFRRYAPDEYIAGEELVKNMEALPLALDQVGAYIEESGCSISDYLQQYRRQYYGLLKRRGGLVSGHPNSVVTTLLLACRSVARHDPEALELLYCCTFLAPDAIPEELFIDSSCQEMEKSNCPNLSYRFDQIVAALRRFSLILRHPETHTFSIHRLVQVVLRAEMSEQKLYKYLHLVIHALNSHFPEDHCSPKLWVTCERLLPHVLTVISIISDQQGTPEVVEVLRKTADYLRERIQYEQAEALLLRAMTIGERAVGPLHPLVASVLNSLGYLCYDLAQYSRAELYLQRAMEIYEQAPEVKHPQRSYPLQGIALLCYRQGKYREAEELYQRVLGIQEAALGSEHFVVAWILNNLAMLYIKQEKYGQAELLLQRILHIGSQILEPEHFLAPYLLGNLGDLYLRQRWYELAEAALQRALQIWEKTLGVEHPRLALPLCGLSEIYIEQGKYEQAEALLLRARAICEQAFSPLHPQTSEVELIQAALCQQQGKDEQAEHLLLSALTIRQFHLSQNHFDIAVVFLKLALLYMKQGKYEQPKRLLPRVLSIFEQSVGLAHPQALEAQRAHSRLLKQLEEAHST